MRRYDIYTALIGVISVFFSLAVYNGGLPIFFKFLLIIFGVIVFGHSAYTLYRSFNDAKFFDDESARQNFQSEVISKISLLNKKGEIINSWELYGKTAAVIGKDIGENHVDIDLSENPYASMIDVEHAVLNYADGNWYIEDLDSQNGISIKKIGQDKIYKLSSLQPCKLDFGDIVIVGICQLKVS
ncbi:MAG: FHA domain-containing protein [Selenomonadaceae bacterium]|nr:FHA domain-containing protein [Selenomonadaceae bacterium]